MRSTHVGTILLIALVGGISYFHLHLHFTGSAPSEHVGSVSDRLETMRLQWMSFRNNSLRLNSSWIGREPLNYPPSSHPRFVVAMYASHAGRDDRFCRSLESAIAHGINVSLLGWNVPWKGLSQKLEAVYRLTKSLSPHDVILFADAYDVLFADSTDKLLRHFLRMNASIVFSAECGCWPHIVENKDTCFNGYPPSPTKARYLNSGAWIGYAAEAAGMLSAIIEDAGDSFENANDQKLAADMYINGRFGIKLDFYNSIFQSMHYTLNDPLPYCYPRKELELNRKGRWINKATKSSPAVFHFNGIRIFDDNVS